MIDVSNLKDALETLGFVAHGDIHEKVFPEIGCSLKVDFQAKRLIYPNEIKGRERNNGFDKKENFVVFECVCRLLSKGYRPEHIELEKEWHLGHDPKGGRADICVTDTSGNMLFIIECKTWGREYDKALNNTKSDGAQLFSYWQQEQSCKWLVLYILRDTYTRPINLFSYDRLLTIIPLVVRVCFQNFHCISNRQRLTHATIIRVIDWLHKLIFIAV